MIMRLFWKKKRVLEKRVDRGRKIYFYNIKQIYHIMRKIASTKTTKAAGAKPKGTQSIERVLSILKKVAQYDEIGVRLSTISQELELHTATVHRMLSILQEQGWVSMDPASKVYRLGHEILGLGSHTYPIRVKELFQGVLERIADQTGDTTYLVTRSGYDALCLDRKVGKFPIQVLTFEIGERRPLGVGAGSLALLSALPQEEFELIIKRNEVKYGNFKRTGKDIRTAVNQCRRLGYGLSVKTVTSETIGIGVAIKNSVGEPAAAISVAGIVKRMEPARREEIVQLIQSEIATVDRDDLRGLL
jgi:DNA-binding IclR family transcriptional regulator